MCAARFTQWLLVLPPVEPNLAAGPFHLGHDHHRAPGALARREGSGSADPRLEAGGGSLFAPITVQWKEYGVRLNFTPTVLADHVISLRLAPSVSDLDYANGTLGDWGIHWLDQILWVTEEKYPKRIYSAGGRPIKGAPILTPEEQTSDAPDHQVATFEFDGFTLFVDRVQRDPFAGIGKLIIGAFNEGNPRWRALARTEVTRALARAGVVRPTAPGPARRPPPRR